MTPRPPSVPGTRRPLRWRTVALAERLRTDKFAGALLLAATVVALVWASSPWRDGYDQLRDTTVGPTWLANLHLDLTVGQWAADGLLTVFFFVVGLELKNEFVNGALRQPHTAAFPVVAAVGGMVVPAGVYLLVNVLRDGETVGWAIPVATDIAFALGVIAVVGRWLPPALRIFLLTLAVVDDLLAITIIAVAYSDTLAPGFLAVSVAAVIAFGAALRIGMRSGWVLMPLAVVAWATMHASGVHATIAGVLLGMSASAVRGSSDGSAVRDVPSVAERLEHRWRPFSSGVAVPVFALFAAGVSLDPSSLAAAAADPVAQGVWFGLVLGKPIGILLGAGLVCLLLRVRLVPGIDWVDMIGISFLAGIGFTVSLLIGELAFGAGTPHGEHIRASVLLGSVVAATVGGILLARRNRVHRLRQGVPSGP